MFTPEDVIRDMGSLLFPPIIRRMEITDEHISPYMKRRLVEENSKPPQSTIVQCYQGKQLLLMTSLIRLYMSRGLKVSNITKFVQYVPSEVLEPFTNNVYEMRCEATREKDECKATTSKLFGNSAYGKTGYT